MNHGETAPDLETFLENAGEQSKKGFKYVASPYWHPASGSGYAGHEPGRRWPP